MKKLFLTLALSSFTSGAFASLEYSCTVKQKVLMTNAKWETLPYEAYVQVKDSIFSKSVLQIYPYGNDGNSKPDVIALEDLKSESGDSQKLIGRIRTFSFYAIDKGLLSGYSSAVVTYHQPASTILEGYGYDLLLDCQRK
jgi:hypothetical protein